MSSDPAIFRPEDMAALVADTVLRLGERAPGDLEPLRAPAAVAAALHDAETKGLDRQGAQYWYWVAAVESALAFAVDDRPASAGHRSLAFRALRRARLTDAAVSLLPVSGWLDADIEAFWKVSLGVQALAILRLRAGHLPRAQVVDDLRDLVSVAAGHGAARLSAAVSRVSRELRLQLPVTASPPADPSATHGLHPADLASQLVSTSRPDLCEPPLKQAVLAELAAVAEATGPAAMRSAELLEALAVADVWPFLFGGPPTGWGAVRSDVLFDSLFYRAAAIGASRRTGSLPWHDLPNLVSAHSSAIWLRELDADLSVVAGASFTPDAGWRSTVVRLGRAHRAALRHVAAGDIRRLAPMHFRQLGELLLEPLLDCGVGPRLLTAVLSPRLRCLPLEALSTGGRQLVDDTLVSVLPSLVAVASRTAGRVRATGPLRILGLFDPELRGAQLEIETLRELVRRDLAEGIGFTGPFKLRQALEKEAADVLTIAAHGTIRGGVPILEPPGRPLVLPELLEWPLPPVVNLGACRTAEGSASAVPLEWLTVALRRGAHSVIAARWPVPDRSAARIASRFYRNLAERRFAYAAAAFFDAVRAERARRDHPWFWAGVGLFGDNL